jgi:hypothetical protein
VPIVGGGVIRFNWKGGMMVKWEYMRIGWDFDFNGLGQDGWELVGFYKDVAVFKRPTESSLREQAELMRKCCERKE